MALPAGRYGVTKNQLLKIKKLPMNTMKLIEELAEKYDLLGSAAFKNSTSVVTDSSDLVESGAVFDTIKGSVGWEVNNEFKPTAKSGTLSGLTYRIDNDGVFLNGTTTAQVSLDYATVILKSGTYTYTDDAVTSDSTYFMNVVPDPTTLTWQLNINTKPLKFTLNQSATLLFKLYIRSGQTFNNEIVFKPKLVHVSVDESKCDNSVIAPVENGSTASQAYAVNDVFIRNGALCKVTSAISQGDTLSNQFTVTNVGAILTALLNA